MGSLDDRGDRARKNQRPADVAGKRTSCGEGLCMPPLHFSSQFIRVPASGFADSLLLKGTTALW